MRSPKFRALSVLLGVLYCLFIGAPSYADDTEIFGAGINQAAGLKPNILFIVDTSGSMDTDVITIDKPFDPSATYTGVCDNSYTYWRRDTGDPPDCATTQKFPNTLNKCKAARDAFGVSGQYIAQKAAMFTPTITSIDRRGRVTVTTVNKWMNFAAGVYNQPVECQTDAGIEGNNDDAGGTARKYVRNRDPAGNIFTLWSSTASDQISYAGADNADRTYVMYSGKYLNWYYDPTNRTVKSRLQIVKDVTTTLVNSVDNVNLGLMRYDNHGGNGETAAEGGMVAKEMQDITAPGARQAMIDTVNSYQPDGFTPLSETLYEAGQYFAGRTVDFGLNSQPIVSVAASRKAADQSMYQTPIKYQCQKDYIVYLTDGEPTQDNNADTKITSLPNFASLVGTADCDDTGPGRCLDDMAKYLFEADLSPLNGKQNVITYTIGFGPEVAGSTFLTKVATRGGGKAYAASDTSTLVNALTNIVYSILEEDTTFTSPSVSVNAFNRTQTLDDLYVSLFRPNDTYHWDGNVKKYKVANGQIVDSLGRPAVDNGFFSKTAQSFWSPSVDGGTVTIGGAASQEPLPAVRKVYTFLGNKVLSDPTNAVDNGNAAMTDLLFGLGGPGLPALDDVVDWMRGSDVNDFNGNSIFDEPRLQMGDPVHAKPAVVVFGGTSAAPETVVFAATNDGFLHAIDGTTGTELWSFVPKELLPVEPQLMANGPTPDKHYALDGDIRVLKIDRNSNGIVENDPTHDDHVYIYFGMRRGGSNYYALDVTQKNNPKFMFMLTPGTGGFGTNQLPGLGQTWSTPAVAKVNVNAGGTVTQNADKLVLIFGGGYEDSQDNEAYNTDTSGNRIYMVDAVNGSLLWFAGGTAAGTVGTPNLALAKMNNSIPADVLVIDLNQDGLADRMYATDTGGRIWRFDIVNGQVPASLVAGGVLASLGNADSGGTPLANTRRFYSAVDAALVRDRGITPYIALTVGSGFRGHPLNVAIKDRFYMVKDKNPFTQLNAAGYAALTIATDLDTVQASNVQDVTTNLAASVPTTTTGWKIELREGASTWQGEKSLSAATIFNNRVFFTTYTPPNANTPADPCVPGLGTNRAWAVSLLNGAPVVNLDGQTAVTQADRYQQLDQTAIASEVVLLFPGGNPGDPISDRPLLCLSGVEVIPGVCNNAGAPVRTFWQESGTN
ncbi:MAG TPA: PilC/PilY family type IV pilus protein [Steroidobacteraceae bacterium]|nr:PilC/PilY family type IV pilus protein [Steroidobacteraceae bacterium]